MAVSRAPPWPRSPTSSFPVLPASSPFTSSLLSFPKPRRRLPGRLFVADSSPSPPPPPPPSPPPCRRKDLPSLTLPRPPEDQHSAGMEEESSPARSRELIWLWLRLRPRRLQSLPGKMASLLPKKVGGILLLNVLTVVYASNIPIVKEAEATTDPALFTVVRFVIAAIPFLPFVWKATEDMQILAAGIELGVWVSLGYITQAAGLMTADAGRSSFIASFTVIIVPLIYGILGAEVPAYTWFGASVSFLGVVMLESSGSPVCVGDILSLLSALCFAIHMVRTEHAAKCTKREKFSALLGCEVLIVALLSAIWFIFKGYVQQPGLSFRSCTNLWSLVMSFPWVPALYTGIFSTGLCLWAELTAMCDVPATEAAIIYGLEPVWGAAFAWFLLGERWDITGWAGAILVIAGSLIVQILGSRS